MPQRFKALAPLVGMVMMFRGRAHRHHAPMRHLAFHVFKLNRGVIDAEVVMQAFLYISENALAH